MKKQTKTTNTPIVYQTGEKIFYLKEGDFVSFKYPDEEVETLCRIRKDELGVPCIKILDRLLLNKWCGSPLNENSYKLKIIDNLPGEVIEFFDLLELLQEHTNIYLKSRHSDSKCKICRDGF